MDKALWIQFLKTCSILAIFPVVLFALAYRWEMVGFYRHIEHHEQAATAAGAVAAAHRLNNIAAIVLMLADQNELHAYLDTGDEALLPLIAHEYLALARTAKIYDQVRFIDANGMERVRVNHKDGIPVVVPNSKLQDKSRRYYFEEAMALDSGSIYVSPLDLNIEQWTIERPYKPMIRLATPVFDLQGRHRGLIVVNFLAQSILDAALDAMKQTHGQPMMLNADGYWLLSPEPCRSWGFMFAGQEDKRMGVIYPKVWQAMHQEQAGHIYTREGLFVFHGSNPLAAEYCALAEAANEIKSDLSYRWYFVSYVAQAHIDEMRTKILVIVVVLGTLVVMLLAAVYQETLISEDQRHRNRAELERLARVDGLTGIANRLAFEERLEQEFEQAGGRRAGHRLALLYFDLDRFKAINDNLGHDVGDQVLKDVANVLSSNCRRGDTAGRFGGDEFVVLLSDVPDEKTAVAIAEKLRDQICALRWRGHAIGVSIGVAVFPDHAKRLAELRRLADEAMYASKAKGKNCVTVAT